MLIHDSEKTAATESDRGPQSFGKTVFVGFETLNETSGMFKPQGACLKDFKISPTNYKNPHQFTRIRKKAFHNN